jgi:hypothetical protein
MARFDVPDLVEVAEESRLPAKGSRRSWGGLIGLPG